MSAASADRALLRIGVFTATRAKCSLLRPVLARMEATESLAPCLIVSGTHLSALDAHMILSDRTEPLAAAAVSFALPVLHLERGHRTAGVVDDGIRHAVTKLSALHFTAAEPYKQPPATDGRGA